MRDAVVFGERLGDVADEMLTMKMTPRSDGGVTVHARFTQDGPLSRALCRAEAELLIADAEKMAAGTFAWRTPAQRQADALLLIAERMGEALDASAANSASAQRPAAARPTRARSSRKRRGRSR